MEADMDMLSRDNPAFLREDESQLTRLTCPECGGAMAQVDLPKISYFRCHVGHQFGPQALAAAQLEASERKLWSAVAALEEQAAVLHYVQRHAPREQKSIFQVKIKTRQSRLAMPTRSPTGPPRYVTR